MLINTVLVFLQNTLPIFVVMSLLFSQQALSSTTYKEKAKKYLSLINLLVGGIVGLSLVLFISHNMASISLLFSGMGVEIIFSILFCLTYLIIASFFVLTGVSRYLSNGELPTYQWASHYQTLLGITVYLLVFCLHGSYFSLYLMSLSFENVAVQPLLVGVIIGTGISLSVSILLYFILVALDKKLPITISRYFLLLFGVGQLMQIIQLIEQVDLISSSTLLWSTNHLIAEESELGYLITILFGYEATPSAGQIVLYLTATLVPILMVNAMSTLKSKRSANKERLQ